MERGSFVAKLFSMIPLRIKFSIFCTRVFGIILLRKDISAILKVWEGVFYKLD